MLIISFCRLNTSIFLWVEWVFVIEGVIKTIKDFNFPLVIWKSAVEKIGKSFNEFEGGPFLFSHCWRLIEEKKLAA